MKKWNILYHLREPYIREKYGSLVFGQITLDQTYSKDLRMTASPEVLNTRKEQAEYDTLGKSFPGP